MKRQLEQCAPRAVVAPRGLVQPAEKCLAGRGSLACMLGAEHMKRHVMLISKAVLSSFAV
eukprot:4968511-Amphidinium_carterae.2